MRLRDHWAASAHLWEGRETRRMWYVTFDGQLDFLRCWLEPILERPYLSPVPAEWLHMTIGEETDDLEVNASDAVYIPAISLVDVRRKDGVYTWDVVERVTLAA